MGDPRTTGGIGCAGRLDARPGGRVVPGGVPPRWPIPICWVAAGAGLGATIAIASVGAGTAVLPVFAFVGAVLAVAAAYALGRSVGVTNPAALVLAGVAVAAFLTAIQTFVLQQNTDDIRAVYAWLLGRLATSGWGEVVAVIPYVAVSAAVILAHRRILDVLRVGDEEPRRSGLP